MIPTSFAADTWDGGDGSSPNWATDTNWVDDGAPVPGAAEALTFDGTTNLTTTNDFAANAQFNTISFSAGAGAFSLGGNVINLGDGVAGVKIANSSANLQSIGLGLNLQQANTGINAGAAGVSISGNLVGAGGLSITGAGGVILSGSNNYSGGTLLASTSFLRYIANAGNTTDGVTSVMSPNSTVTLGPVSAGVLPVLQLRANSSTTFAPASLVVSGTLTQSRTFEINVDNNGSGTNQTLHLAGSVAVSGVGGLQTNLKITGNNGYGLWMNTLSISGNTNGILSVDASAPLRVGTFQLNGSTQNLNLVGTNTVTLGEVVRTLSTRNLTINQNGPGTLVLAGSASTTSANVGGGYFWNINSGQVHINHADAVGVGANLSTATYNRILTLAQGVTLDNTSGAPITVLNGNTTIAGTATAGANLNVFHLIFNGDVTWGGTHALEMNVGSSSGQGTMKGAVLLGSDNAGATRTITTNGTAPLTLNSAIHNGTAGGVNLVKAGLGTLQLSGVNQYSGNTTVTAGTLVVNGAAVASQTMEGGTVAAGTANNNRITVASSAGLVVGQTITGDSIAAGSYIVSINGGNVFMNKAGLATGTSNVTFGDGSATGRGSVVVTGGRLLGGGTIRPIGSNSISVSSGARIGAGTTAASGSLAKLTIDLGATSGGADFASGSIFEFELGAASSDINDIPAGASDTISVTNATAGDVIFGGNVIDLWWTGNSDGFYKLFDTDGGAGTWTGLTVNSEQIITGGLTLANLGYGVGTLFQGDGTTGDAGDIYLQMTGTPEPSTTAVLLAGGMALLRRRRRSS